MRCEHQWSLLLKKHLQCIIPSYMFFVRVLNNAF